MNSGLTEVVSTSSSERKGLFVQLSELWQYRGLLRVLIYRDIRVKYKQSILGFLWAILMPLLIVMVGVLVRYAYSLASGNVLNLLDVVGVAVKSVPWAFTVGAIRTATNCLIGNSALVTKIYFPKEVFPLAAVGSNLFDFAIACVPLCLLVVVGGGHLGLQLLMIPVLLLVLTMIIVGAAMIVSAASLFFRDVKYLVEVALTFGIFVTPVLFDVTMFGRFGIYMMLNPVSPVLEGLKAAALGMLWPQTFWIGYSAAFGVLVLFLGYVLFKRLEPAFAESI